MGVNVKKIVNDRVSLLKNSNKTFKDIINIMFKDREWIFSEDNDGYKIYKHTFGEVYDLIKDKAYSINSIYPSLKGEYVGLAMDNSLNFVVSLFAIITSGNMPYLINLRHPKSLVISLVNELKIKYIIGNENLYPEYEFIDYKALDKKYDSNYEFNYANEIALSTSATSMNQKIVFFNGEEISYQILNCEGILKNNKQIKMHYKDSLKQLVFLPLYHIFGLVATFLWFSYFGRTMVFLSDYSSDTILYTIKRHEVTHIFAVPLFWNMVARGVKNELKKQDQKTQDKFIKGQKLTIALQKKFPSYGIKKSKKLMKKITENLFGNSVMFMISGGAYISDDIMYLFNSLGYPLYNGYGMTEIGITSVELGNVKDRLKNSIGCPFDSIEYKIENDTLYVKGKSISHRMIVNSKEIILSNDDCFSTNDIVKKDDTNRYYILGRKDDIIILDNGENINPDVIEKEFVIDKALSYSVTNIDNNLSIIISIDKYVPYAAIKNIYDYVVSKNNSLNTSIRLKKIYFTYDKLLADTAIKVSRTYLKNKLENGSIKLIDFSDIDSSKNIINDVDINILNKVKELIAKYLSIDIEKITDTSDFFFDLGASSLDYFSLISEINNEFMISIPFENDSMHTPLDIAKVVMETLAK